MSFNRELFAVAIEARLREQKLGLREAARQSGVSASTLSRLISGNKVPDMEIFEKVLAFTGREAGVFFTEPKRADLATQTHIVALLRHDPILPVEARESIIALVRAAYECFAREWEAKELEDA